MASNINVESLNITPNPRILRTLGEIPFESWQCFAELIDNSIDAFQYADRAGIPISKRQIVISWTTETTASVDRKVEIRDTGPGMNLDSIRSAVTAGYSSKNPMDSLGLFGMGFNISTARLGEETMFLSTRAGDTDWKGVLIDFQSMINNQNYEVPVQSFPKANPAEHGTRIIIGKLKPGIYDRLKTTESQIRDTLSDVYSPVLRQMDSLELLVQRKRCKPVPYCVWDETRYVVRNGEKIHAVLPIDEYVGTALFDIQKNRYLMFEEEESVLEYYNDNDSYPEGIVEREKRITGWLGIQRYGDPSLFGIDFVRNGRKVLRKEKSLFSYYISATGTDKLEYPVELGTTWGGRIVGEINVDHLIPTYQKNDFDRSDPSWFEVVNKLRGDGPIQAKTRTIFNYQGTNNSYLGQLIRGFGRMDPGTKWMAIKSDIAKEWYKKFLQGESDYQTDAKWWEAAQQADQSKADRGAATSGAVNHGSAPSDDTDSYAPPTKSNDSKPKEPSNETKTGSTAPTTASDSNDNKKPKASTEDDEISDLLNRSVEDQTLTMEYRYRNCPSPLKVEVRRMTTGVIGSPTDGEPVRWDRSNFRSLKFFYNPMHPFFLSRKTLPHEIMLLQLASIFQSRDRLTSKDLTVLYIELLEEMFPNERIDLPTVQERATSFFDQLRSVIVDMLSSREAEVLETLHEHSGDLEDTLANLVPNPDLQLQVLKRLPGGVSALTVVPERVLLRLISKYPEEFFDGKFFKVLYQTINLPSQEATERLREDSKDRVISYVKDAEWALSPSASQRRDSRRQFKDELIRCSHSLDLLEEVMIEL
ncbi:hypothetical protein J5TS2_42130 [Brevibacillus halotolerans]|uniref:ATP-binding protein n=1 Tax=Brevibacillus halotolerans TaxID=1507437 RepID=UPI001B182153|nr:ATP-binding protein [Brevibacillus halotolerans]GIO03545.1 hypothetical protein J5TS2_42130 [Brevibacillus halotolerans]